MATTKKRISLNLSKEDLRILKLMENHSEENINTLVKKALFFYYLKHFAKDEKK